MRFRLRSFVVILPFLFFSGSAIAKRIDVTDSECSAKAIPNDSIDDADAFECALSELEKSGGGVLEIPTGVFSIARSLRVGPNVTVRGEGFGSILHQPHKNLAGVFEIFRAGGLRDLQLSQEHPNPGPSWEPYTDYDFQVKVRNEQVLIDNVKFLNPLKALLIAPNHKDIAVGQVFVHNIKGQPLQEGIRIDQALDVVRISQVHFWPFWSTANDVLKWTAEYGVGVRSLRNDNPLFSSLFFFGYARGMQFDVSTCDGYCGVTSKPKIMQMDCDFCKTGILINAPNTKGVLIHQLSVQGYLNFAGVGPSGVGVHVAAPHCSINIDQSDFTEIAANAVRTDHASGSVIRVRNSMVRSWNTTKAGFPAFEVHGDASKISFLVSDSWIGDGAGALTASSVVTLRDVEQIPDFR